MSMLWLAAESLWGASPCSFRGLLDWAGPGTDTTLEEEEEEDVCMDGAATRLSRKANCGLRAVSSFFNLCMYVCMYTLCILYVYMYVCMYLCIDDLYVCMYVCMYVCVWRS